jgi:hypothetical protein
MIGILVFSLIAEWRRHRREEEQPQEDARERDAVSKSILANGLEGMSSDDVSMTVFRWLQRHEGKTVRVQRGKPEDCLHEKYIEWTIPPFEMDMKDVKDQYGNRVRYTFRCVRYSFIDEYGSVSWEFPPETWHESDLSEDRLVYSIGWDYDDLFLGIEMSATVRSQLNDWSHWTLTAQTGSDSERRQA